jgi:hypothetical protein
MCSLCGLLGGADHWTDALPRGSAAPIDPPTRRRLRRERIENANVFLRYFGLSLKDWRGGAYLLSDGRGKTLIVRDLAELCVASTSMLGKPIDPLDARLLDKIEAAVRS